MFGKVKMELAQIEGKASDDAIKYVKECGYCMAEKLGLLDRIKEEERDRKYALYKDLLVGGFAVKDIVSAFPTFVEFTETQEG